MIQTARLGLLGPIAGSKRWFLQLTADYAGQLYLAGTSQSALTLSTINVPGATGGVSVLFWKMGGAYWFADGLLDYRLGVSSIAADFHNAFGATGKLLLNVPRDVFTIRLGGWVSWHQVNTTRWIQDVMVLGLEIGVGWK